MRYVLQCITFVNVYTNFSLEFHDKSKGVNMRTFITEQARKDVSLSFRVPAQLARELANQAQARDWKLALMARKALALGLAELAQNKAASGQAGGQAGASVD